MNYYSETITANDGTEVTLTKVNHDMYGNPRYVAHYLEFADDYNEAHALAKKLGFRKYTAKWYGGGFVCQCYDVNSLADEIAEIKTNK